MKCGKIKTKEINRELISSSSRKEALNKMPFPVKRAGGLKAPFTDPTQNQNPVDSRNGSQNKTIENENTVELKQLPTSTLVIFKNLIYPP